MPYSKLPPNAPKRRTEDNDKLAKLSAQIDRWKAFYLLAAWILSILGFGLITPKQTAKELQAEIDGLTTKTAAQVDTLTKRTDSLKHTHGTMEGYLKFLVKNSCLKMTQKEKDLLSTTEVSCP